MKQNTSTMPARTHPQTHADTDISSHTVDKAEAYQQMMMPTQSQDAIVVMAENRDDEEKNKVAVAAAPLPPTSASSDSTTASSASVSSSHENSMQIYVHDSKGNKIHISSMKQLRALAPLLEDDDHDHEQIHTSYDTNNNRSSSSDQRQTNESEAISVRGCNTSQQTFLDEVKRFELFRSVIQHEDDLLNQRVSWIILAQSFLMAAFITNVSDDGSGDALKYITAIVGLLTVVVTMPAILAAGRNIELQQAVYFAKISSEGRCHELHGHGRNIMGCNKERGRKINMKEEKRDRLKYGHIFPNMAFRGRGGVPILLTVVMLAVVQVAGWCFLLVALVKGW